MEDSHVVAARDNARQVKTNLDILPSNNSCRMNIVNILSSSSDQQSAMIMIDDEENAAPSLNMQLNN